VSSSDLETLLSKLPIPSQRSLLEPRGDEEDIDYVTANAIDFSQLEAAVAWPAPKAYSALRELIAKHKADLFVLRGVIDNDDHPQVPRGTKFEIWMVFRGLLPPQLRPPPEEVEKIIRSMERRGGLPSSNAA
jgi:hypothetical protein